MAAGVQLCLTLTQEMAFPSEWLVMPSRVGHLETEDMKSQTQQTSSSLAGLKVPLVKARTPL